MGTKYYIIPTRSVFRSHNILYYSHKIGILFQQHIILFSPHAIYLLSIKGSWPGTGTEHVATLNKFCESSCIYIYTSTATDKRHIESNRRPESRMYRAYACGWERERERERVCVRLSVVSSLIVAFSALLLYYVAYIAMFVLPLVRLMEEGWDPTKLVQPNHTYG